MKLLPILCSALILASCDSLFSTHNLRILHSNNINQVDLQYFPKRRIYYISNSTISYLDTIHVQNELDVNVDKLFASPVLSCTIIQNESSINQCFWAMGAIYPNDINNEILELEPYTKAEAAKFLLDFYSKRSEMPTINIQKLYNTLNKKLAEKPLDMDKVYSYIQKGTLSYWGFDAKDSIKIPINVAGKDWLSTSFWIRDIRSDTQSIDLYEGIWKFYSNDKIATIFVDTNEQFSFVGFD